MSKSENWLVRPPTSGNKEKKSWERDRKQRKRVKKRVRGYTLNSQIDNGLYLHYNYYEVDLYNNYFDVSELFPILIRFFTRIARTPRGVLGVLEHPHPALTKYRSLSS